MATIVLTAADNGRSLDVNVGDVVQLHLAENPTTGYRWEVEQVDASLLARQAGSMPGESESAPGAGRTVNFAFAAVRAGTAFVQLKHWQRWDGDVDQRFSATLRVRA